MKQKTLYKKTCSLILMIVMAVSLFVMFQPQEAQAASTELKLLERDKTVKAGSYYFKASDGKITYSSSKNGTYKVVGFKGSISYSTGASNGKDVVAIESRNGEDFARLSVFNLSSGKLKTIKKLSLKTNSTYMTTWNASWNISNVYGNSVFIRRSDYFGNPRIALYVYNLSSNRFRLEKNSCQIRDQDGKYLVTTSCEGDLEYYNGTLCKANSNGKITTIKKLGDEVGMTSFSDKYVYYDRHSYKYRYGGSEYKTEICRCDKMVPR